MNNWLLITLDSCRYDSFVEANPKNMLSLGKLEKRYSYASWTFPSHCNLLTGVLNHTNRENQFPVADLVDVRKKYRERLGVPDLRMKSLLPRLWLPDWLRNRLGYNTTAITSMAPLNNNTIVSTGFEIFHHMHRHNTFKLMLPLLKFNEDNKPSFYLMNIGETHYPYATPDEPPYLWPRLSGAFGAFKDDFGMPDKFFNKDEMAKLRKRQINTVQYVDTVMNELFNMVPKGTYVTITADHGDCFGEGGHFGHAAVCHPKVFEVPWVEGLVK